MNQKINSLNVPILQTVNLRLSFSGNTVLNDISCDFYSGSLVSLVGPNGAGKTSFFNLISGHLKPDSGQILLNSQDISKLSVPARVAKGIGRGFQINQLFPDLSVFENIYLSLAAKFKKGHKFWSMANKESQINQLCDYYLHQVNLLGASNNIVSQLSHGEQRKLEIALLLALDSDVLLLDEPTAGLGVDEVPVITDLIRTLKANNNKLILLIEHKLEAVKELSDRLLVLNNGKIIADGMPNDVMLSADVKKAYLGGL